MKIQCDGKDLYDISDWEMSILKNDINADDLPADIERRLVYIITHKIEQCWGRFEKEWTDKLRADPTVSLIPTDKEAFTNLVISRPDYQDRKAKDEAIVK